MCIKIAKKSPTITYFFFIYTKFPHLPPQVNEKEKQKIVSRQKMFEEGLAIRAESDQRRRRLRETMERKCQEMRENKVPDMYINEVKRMIENIK